MPYDGPYKVISRDDQIFIVRIKGKNQNISIDRLKPAYTIDDEIEEPNFSQPLDIPVQIRQQLQPQPQLQQPRRSTRRVRFPDRYQAGLD